MQLSQRGDDFLDHLGGEPEKRLIEQQQRRLAHQCAADRQHLLFAAGHGPGPLVRAFREPRKQIEHIVVTLGQAAAAGQRDRAEAKIVAHREGREDLPAFRHQRHAGGDELVACGAR